MKTIGYVRNFINKERLYVWILIFIIFVNILNITTGPKVHIKQSKEIKAKEESFKYDYSLTQEKLKILMKEKREVVFALNFLVLLVMFSVISGLMIDFYLVFNRNKKNAPFEITKENLEVTWNVWDVCKVAVLFVFFGYILVLSESGLDNIFPAIKTKEHVRMMVNSSVLDILAIVFVLYVVVSEYGKKIKNLGLSVSSFFKNIFIGLSGYLAALPAILGSLLLVVWIAKLVNYEPPVEPVLKLFLEEKNVIFIFYSAVFVTILGPICEEIFFRGFLFASLRKRMGSVRAILITSAFFSLLHTNMIGFIPIMILGVLLAYLYEVTGSLVSPIIVHIIHNTGMMAFIFLLKEMKIY
ncbi:MAG: hypothetical protein COS99_01840 [Candidatus Omnitrophica bacterium CG07_land_8_20_14_0_80_42_15]|uniref:CAAX prenyl protease 2/Lysostaphin resistance protein A-like domain-containing protein n=1 Tax=Candidatus Aquitaenariimonas noxiae TaxID=1974741 RepID=A0A2J0KWF1_9BACT|nr:MAG: hypothetical protein COS99_01840 [Candidatus Omnitrophica bacterium CG07_land_8_20_14_0_80_42_15]